MSYEENMNAIMNLPIVKELMKKNKKLQKKNKALRNLIYSLPEFRCSCHNNCCGQNKVQPLFEQTLEFVDKVFIKKEPGTDEVREPDVCIDDEVVILDKNPNEKPNIVYEIEEVVEETEEVVEETEEVVEETEEVEEETEEVVEETEEVEEETEEVEEETEEVEEETEEDAGEVYEITISGKSYYVTDEKNGKIYAIDKDEDVGDEIGEFKNGKPSFYK
uniref:Uncharacterized protein n=1 Tax=viral metagenome TaxID=1070528 RepID=A0A6C0DBV5_9ZZZZ